MLSFRASFAALLAAAFIASSSVPAFAQTAATKDRGSKSSAGKGDAKGDAKGEPGASKETKPSKEVKPKAPKRTAGEAPAGPADYSSKNFLVHTDIPPDEAKDLLVRLETMLVIISKYWGRPNSQTIEVYVIKDVNKWPQGSIDPRAIDSITGGGGITLGRVRTLGGTPVAAKAPAFAVADRGTPQHEAVHAYCIQAFGTTGPVWYAEGMAEMGQYWKDGEKAVSCHEIVSDYLRKSRVKKSLNEIVNAEETTGDSWQTYAWRWALCHLLATNENYAARFRPLGLELLTKQTSSFEDVYGSMAKEISFEYLFFLEHVAPGFRCDLCSWDWKAKSRLPKGSFTTATIEAARGWQPTRALVKDGEEYQFSAAGNWKTAKDGTETDADGGGEGTGRLVGVLFNDYKLGEEFDLGAYGAFTAKGDGQLFVRCRDSWTELGDNAGKLTVKIAAGGAKPLPNPKDRVKGAKGSEKPAPGKSPASKDAE
jgi:hypothetical protein